MQELSENERVADGIQVFWRVPSAALLAGFVSVSVSNLRMVCRIHEHGFDISHESPIFTKFSKGFLPLWVST